MHARNADATPIQGSLNDGCRWTTAWRRSSNQATPWKVAECSLRMRRLGYNLAHGSVAERTIALALKACEPSGSVGSNPTASANQPDAPPDHLDGVVVNGADEDLDCDAVPWSGRRLDAGSLKSCNPDVPEPTRGREWDMVTATGICLGLESIERHHLTREHPVNPIPHIAHHVPDPMCE